MAERVRHLRSRKFNAPMHKITLSRTALVAAEFLTLQMEVMRWVKACIDQFTQRDNVSKQAVSAALAANERLNEVNIWVSLRDGVALCGIMRAIEGKELIPPSVGLVVTEEEETVESEDGPPKRSVSAFVSARERDNIAAFLDACRYLGLNDQDLFTTACLHEKKRLLQVICALRHLGRIGPSLGLPLLQVLDNANINFSREQLLECNEQLKDMGEGDRDLLMKMSKNRQAELAEAVATGEADGQAEGEKEGEAQETDEKETKHVMSLVTNVEVNDPRREGGLLFKHTTYGVTTTFVDGSKQVMRRRFKEFLWLENQMCQRWPETDLPPLPEKRIGGGDVEDRSMGLQDFLSNVVWHYKLRRHPAVRIFLFFDLKLVESGLFGYSTALDTSGMRDSGSEEEGEKVEEK